MCRGLGLIGSCWMWRPAQVVSGVRQILVVEPASRSAVSVDNLMRALPERQVFPVAGADLRLWPEEVYEAID